jgi:tetratricopeptide (TPR) repeat protein
LQLFREGKYSDAITAFNSAIELEPKYVYFFQRGRVYMNLKNCDAAIKDFDRVISLNPDVKDAYFHRGRCLRRMGKKKEGSNEIRKAASMGSGNAKRWLKAKGKREQSGKSSDYR